MLRRLPTKPVLIEFTGTSGAGKTTLARNVIEMLQARDFAVTTASEVILGRFGLAAFPRSHLGAIVMNAIAFMPFLLSLRRENSRRLFGLVVQSIFDSSQPLSIKLNVLRNVIKHLGIHSILRSLQRKSAAYDIIIVDEGSLHIVQNVFAHVGARPDRQRIETFANLVPLPDLVVWVTAPMPQLVSCILRRGHKRIGRSYSDALTFLSHSTFIYNVLFTLPVTQSNLLRVHNNSQPGVYPDLQHNLQTIVDAIEAILREGFPPC